MELKARLFSLENQINSLQSLLKTESPRSYDENFNENGQENLKNILMSKEERE